MYLARSGFSKTSRKRSSTKAGVTTTLVPDFPGREKDTSSSSRSITVCRRRAPIFSAWELALAAISESPVDCLVLENELHALRSHQLAVLESQGVLRLGEDAPEIRGGQGVQFHPDGEAALQLRNQVLRLGDVEGAGRDEQDMGRIHDPVLRVDLAALHDGQDVPLNAFAGYVDAARTCASRVATLSISSMNTMPISWTRVRGLFAPPCPGL